MAIRTPVATVLGGAIGCKYIQSTNQLVLVAWAKGNVSAIDLATKSYHVLGTGVAEPCPSGNSPRSSKFGEKSGLVPA
jgi:hypothetical protein